MNLNIDPEWLLKMVEAEDACGGIYIDTFLRNVIKEEARLDSLLLEKLKETPLDHKDSTKLFREHNVCQPSSNAIYASRRLVEQGKAKFNDEWLLEIVKEQS